MKNCIKLSKILIIRVLVVLILVSILIVMEKIEKIFLGYSNGTKILDMRFGYNYQDVFQLFRELGKEGRSIYSKYLSYDFIFTISFAIVQNYILKFVMGKNLLNSKWRALLYISYLRAFFDIIENIIILSLLNDFPIISLLIVTVASSTTRLKFIVYGIWMLAILICIIVRISKEIKKRGI